MTDVILLERIERLGQLGQVVKVKPGYARNYLLPQKKALRATKSNLAYFETQKAEIEAQNKVKRDAAEKQSKSIDGKKLVLIRQAGETGMLYGSVSNRDISEALSTKDLTVDKATVIIDQPIKMLGLYTVRVRLHPEVTVSVKVNVARSAEEADLQEKSGEAVRNSELAKKADAENVLAEAEAAEAATAG